MKYLLSGLLCAALLAFSAIKGSAQFVIDPPADSIGGLVDEEYRLCRESFENEDYPGAIRSSLDLLSKIDDTLSLKYGQLLLLVGDSYLNLKDYSNAARYYQRILQSDLNDSLYTGDDIIEPMANFKNNSVKGMAWIYEFKQDWDSSLFWLRQTQKYPHLCTANSHHLEDALEIMQWYAFLYEKKEMYDSAVYINLNFIIDYFWNGVREAKYLRANQRLANLVADHYERYSFKSDLDKALEAMTVTREDDMVVARFHFLGLEFSYRIRENGEEAVTDENHVLILQFENKKKDQAYFINLVKGQLFYERISQMDGADLENKNGRIYYGDHEFSGDFFEYWASGVCRTQGKCVDGLFDGAFKFFHKNGQLKDSGSMSNNLQQGFWRSYYDNGAIESEGSYIDGMQDGKWTMWYPSGKQLIPLEFNSGNLGSLYIEGTSDEDIPLQKKAEIVFKKGVEDGLVTIWFDNGQMFRQGTYADGQRTGKWMEWNEEGKATREAVYKNGVLKKGDDFNLD